MLEEVDLSLKLDNQDYEKKILDVQLKLVLLQQHLRQQEVPVCVMYEGWDASGKGGSILRITEKLDPRGFRVFPIGVPTDIEKRHHYLWRFWINLPPTGEIAIFDRSWYGRVLVERVEKFAKREEWQRAYDEINNFERSLVDNGTVLVKFWMHISKGEQKRRFEDREHDQFKEWKITPEDWRNRDKWDDYLKAAEDMFAKTSTDYAPWHIIPAEDKHYARVETANTVARAIETALKK
jgi:polyphosphate kinase 2 (PPK2 family)